MKKENFTKYLPATTTFVNISDSDVSQIIDYAKSLITDFMPVLTLVVAVGLGLIIISVIIRAIRGH